MARVWLPASTVNSRPEIAAGGLRVTVVVPWTLRSATLVAVTETVAGAG